ncbi:MAG: signal recognition particle-docking protein FtsY [Sediminibacterium sp.]|nr:signal recognition particle-docking protein FtsY [Sediminibacterium sp.]
MGIFSKLFSSNSNKKMDEALETTKGSFWSNLTKAIVGKSTINQDVLDNIEEALIQSDVGVETTIAIIESLEKNVSKQKYTNSTELLHILKSTLLDFFNAIDYESPKINTQHKSPHVILVVGVNGVGKTTTIGKLAHFYKSQHLSVLIGAADTFRAAATDQLDVWATRANVPIIKQGMGADPSAVAFDTIQSAIAKNIDVVIIDTAGRLHNKPHLMDELNKIKRVIQKKLPTAPHEVLLVLDGSTGQNAIEQATRFSAVTHVTDLVITKLDGTAKGGVVLSIVHQLKIPIKYIGTGEKIEDLALFNKNSFIDSLISHAI